MVFHQVVFFSDDKGADVQGPQEGAQHDVCVVTTFVFRLTTQVINGRLFWPPAQRSSTTQLSASSPTGPPTARLVSCGASEYEASISNKAWSSLHSLFMTPPCASQLSASVCVVSALCTCLVGNSPSCCSASQPRTPTSLSCTTSGGGGLCLSGSGGREGRGEVYKAPAALPSAYVSNTRKQHGASACKKRAHVGLDRCHARLA